MSDFTPEQALAALRAGRDLPAGAYIVDASDAELLALRQAREFWVAPSESNLLGDPPEPYADPVRPG